MTPRIAVLILATNKYTDFIKPLTESIKRYFLVDCVVEPIILTNRPDAVDGHTLPIAHLPWPGVTIRKYHYVRDFAAELRQFDYLFLCDADMRVVSPIGRDILGEMTAVRHSGYIEKPPSEFPYERNPRSTAFVEPGEGKFYAQACFFGGLSRSIISASEILAERIEEDWKNQIVAIWHDESHLNRYLVDHPPDVLLSPAYAFPEGASIPYDPKIMALNKDHSLVRTSGMANLMIHGRRLARRGGALLRRITGGG